MDSPLEGDGFELPVRGRGQSGCRPFWVGCADRVRVRARRFWDSAVSATRLGDLSRRRRGGPPHRSIDEGSVFRVEHRVAGAMAPDRRDRPQFGLLPSTSLSSSTSSATGCHPRPATRRRSTAAVTRISRRPTMLVLDVRGPDEFTGPLGHIREAKNVPLNELPAHLHDLVRNDRPVVVVCKTDR